MATTLPPILLRNTYPPGQPEQGWAPRPLRRTPEGVNEIMFPGSIIGSHFQGPLISGPVPGVDGAAGSAVLLLSLKIDYTMGDFSVQVPFPGGSFLQSLNAVTYETGLGATVTLGTQTTMSDIGTVPLPALNATAAPIQPSRQLPLWDAVLPEEPFTAWINVTGNTGATAGGAIVLINYIRIAAPWSDPALNHNRP